MNRTTTLMLLIVLALAAPLAALAQGSHASVTDDAASGDQAFQQAAQAGRQRIADERVAARARYDEDRRACWQRFAVNACIDQARARRRVALDALRHDELALNAQERERRTAARRQEIADKQAARADTPEAPASAP